MRRRRLDADLERALCGAQCLFDGGRVVEDGVHEELLAHNGTYAKLYQSQYAPQDVPSTEADR
ncbi:MAG: ABC transporter ATP-binding protein [Nitrososphaerota archaeon]|nr:ABC transporter ATP-binding protein [Nitrososphaerota archaeon]